MKILIGCLSFKELTGAELYCYELAKELLEQQHDVTLVAYEVGQPLLSKAWEIGLKVYKMQTLVDAMKIPNDTITPDVIHTQHQPVTETLINLFPNVPKVTTIHSELLDIEQPIFHESVKHYIAITPNVQKHLWKTTNLPLEKITTIENPIDGKRFNTDNTKDEGYVLLCGSINYLRIQMLEDIAKQTKKEKRKLIVIGKVFEAKAVELLKQKHITHINETEQVEKYVKNCHMVCGLYYGRAIIEGWLCGKSAYGYDVGLDGVIQDCNIYHPQTIPNIDNFLTHNATNKIVDIYNKIK